MIAGLSELESLAFVRGDYDHEDYWSLVQHCRQSIPEDKKRAIQEVVHDHKKPLSGWYELVWRPVAAFWEQRVAMDDSDQCSFHLNSIRLLNALIQHAKGKAPWQRRSGLLPVVPSAVIIRNEMMLPQPLIIQFWLRVRDLAHERHGISRADADRAIADYLALAEKHRFTDAIYHRNAEEVADIVAHAARYGLSEPVTA